MNHKKRNPSVSTCLSSLMLIIGVCCPFSLLYAQSQSSTYEQTPQSRQQSSRTPANTTQNTSRQPRQNHYYGTFHEGIVMETDPQTGSRIIQVSPPPKKQKEPDADNTYIISPEIKINQKQ